MVNYNKSEFILGSILVFLLTCGFAAKLSIDKDPLRPKSIRHSHNSVGSSVLSGLNPAFQPTTVPSLPEDDDETPLKSSFLAPTHPSSSYSDETISDRRIFVTTVDGRYHLINGNSVEWSSDSLDPTVFAVDSATEDHPRESTYKRVIPDVDGSLLVLTSDGMRKTHNKASNLADKAPYISEDGIAFTSEKSSRVIRVDMSNGNIRDFSKKRRAGGGPSEEFGGSSTNEDESETECAIPFFLARVDYSVSGVDIASGEVFQISYSDVEPLQKPLYEDNDNLHRSSSKSLTADSDLARGSGIGKHRRAGGKGGGTGNTRSVLPFADTLAKITDSMEDHGEDQSFFGFEIQTSPNGEVYFVDPDGNYLTDMPLANLGSLVKNAYLVQLPEEAQDGETPVRPMANNLRKLNVVRRMNGFAGAVAQQQQHAMLSADERMAAAIRADGSVLVQTVEYGADKGVYAVEIPPACVNCGNDVDESSGVSVTKNESLLLCPPVGSAALGSKQNALCVSVDDATAQSSTTVDESESPDSGAGGVVTFTHMTPPKAVTTPQLPAVDSRIYIGDNAGLKDAVAKVVSVPSVVDSVDTTSIGQQPPAVEDSSSVCKVFCQCTVRDALDLLSMSQSEEDCIDMDVCCDPKPVALTEIAVEKTIDDFSSLPRFSTVAGQHRLLPDAYEGKIFRPAINGREPVPIPTSAADPTDLENVHEALSTVVVKLPLYRKLLRFLSHISRQQWFLPFCLFVIILLVVTVGPSTYFYMGIIESMLGKTVELDQRRLPLPKSSASSDKLKVSSPEMPKLSSSSSKAALNTNGSITSGVSNTPITPHTPSSSSGAAADVEEVDEFGRKVTRIGALVVHTEPILGYGSHGTVVFPGSLNGRPVAVKRMLSQFHKSADRCTNCRSESFFP